MPCFVIRRGRIVGLVRTLGKRVYRKVSRVRIPPSPPNSLVLDNHRIRMTDKKHNYYLYILRGIQVLLVFSIIASVGVIIYRVTAGGSLTLADKINQAHHNVELLFSALLTLILVSIPGLIDKKRNIRFPDILSGAVVMFVFASIYLSARLALYGRYFWWDDLLHLMSGIIIGFIGFLLIYKLNERYSMNISPLLVAVFAICFAVTLGVFWEIAEFSSDAFFRTSTQKWDQPADSTMIGKSYQGSGLRDTMSDLILDVLGGFATSMVCYSLYKNEKDKTIKAMKRVFPEK